MHVSRNANRNLSRGFVAPLIGLLLFTIPWSHGPMAAHGHQGVEAGDPTTMIVHIADRVNVSGTLQLASPQTIGIDRVRLLQSLMPYDYTVDTRIVSARRSGDKVTFDISAPGRIAMPVYLHLLLEEQGDLDRVASMNAIDQPARRSQNSFRIEVMVDPVSFAVLDRAEGSRQLILLIAPM